LAKQLADEAKQLALTAKSLSGAPKTNQTNNAAQQQVQEKGFDWSWLFLIIVLVLVFAGGYYLLAKRRK
jgi:cytochrome c-type biogenesis protein CcmH/NrfG